jgi:hypothetical protein
VLGLETARFRGPWLNLLYLVPSPPVTSELLYPCAGFGVRKGFRVHNGFVARSLIDNYNVIAAVIVLHWFAQFVKVYVLY